MGGGAVTVPDGTSAGGRRRQLGAFAVIALGTAVVGAVSLGLSNADRPSASPSAASPSRTATGASAEPGVNGQPASRAFLDGSVDPTISDPLGPTTLHPTWLVAGQWWAALLDPPTAETRLYRLGPDGSGFTDTGRILDERPAAVVDALFANGHLYVASAVRSRSVGDGIRLTRYSPDAKTGVRADPDFPIRVTERGVRSLSLARDDTGRLWLATVTDGQLLLAHSGANDATWTTPTAMDGPGAMANDDLAVVVAFGPGRLGVAWTSRATNAIHFVWRADQDPIESWSSVETVSAGVPLGRDPITATAGPDGSVLMSIAADVRGSTSSRDAARLTVARRDATGTWTATVAGRVEDRLGPSALLVGGGGEIDLLTTQQATGSAWALKRSREDRLEFETGPGVPLAVPAGAASVDLGGPHVAAGAWSSASPVLVVGFDGTLGRYVHALIGTAPVQPGPSAAPSSSPGPARSPAPSGGPSGGPVAALPLAVIDDTFDPFAPGVVAPNGWTPRQGDNPDRIVVAASSGRGGVLVLRSTASDSTRACKAFSTIEAGGFTASVVVRLDGLGTADATITSLRQHSSEAALVRFGSGGTFAYYSGASKVRTRVAWKLGTWYRSTVHVDVARGTYDWQLSVDGVTAPLVRVARIPFRDPGAKGADSICVQTSSGRAGLGLSVDRVVVTR
jgi:hypothetical protein